MTQQPTNHTIASQVAAVNALLEAGEPANVSVDSYSGFTGYKPQYLIDAMNEAFGYGMWGFEELSSEIESSEKGALAVSKVKVWLASVDFQPAAWGQARVTKGDLGDARKGAQTDAIKKALSYFSIGNRAYQGLLIGSNLDDIKSEVKEMGLVRNPQQWASWKKSVLGQDVPDERLSAAQIARLNGAVDRKPAA